jgi:hypothetical protein
MKNIKGIVKCLVVIAELVILTFIDKRRKVK